jgi:hypothetical protein
MNDPLGTRVCASAASAQTAVGVMPQPRSVLLDTCVLARLSLYFQACLAAKLKPGCTIGQLQESMRDLRLCSRPEDLLAGGSIGEGQRTWTAMATAPDNHYSYSLLSQLETQVLLEEKAVDARLLGRVPFRLWRNKPLRMQTEIDYDTEVLGMWTNLIDTLETIVNMECIERADSVRPSDIVEVSNILSRYLILDPIDLYLYSCAVFAMVDDVWTYDTDLRILVDGLTSNGHLQIQRQAIVADLSRLNGKFAPGEFVLPRVVIPQS